MHVLSYLRPRTKHALLLGLVSFGISASILRQRMTDDRIDKLRCAVEMSVGLAQSFAHQAAAHVLTPEQALEQFRTAAC